MKLINRTELKFENYEKCEVVCDNDCPIGQLYDFACAFKAFLVDRMKEEEKKPEAPKE